MNFKKRILIVSIAMLILGGAGCVGSKSYNLTSERKSKISQSGSEAELAGIYDGLARVLGKSNQISPDTYKEIDAQLNKLESKGVNTESARILLAKFEIGGLKKEAPAVNFVSPQTTSVKQVQTVTTTKPVAPKSVAVAPAKTPTNSTEQLPAPTTTKATSNFECVSNPNPVFTHHITDPNIFQYVIPPPTMGGNGQSLKTHSYIVTNFAEAPVYAPVDMVLDTGAHYTVGPYWLGFTVSCEVKLRFAHITDPIQAIKDVFPAVPQEGSHNMPVKQKIAFKAGDLIGYTIKGNWDFGVYNSTKINRYAVDPVWGISTVYTTAVCPFDYYSAQMKAVYTSKFDTKILEGNPPHGESFCKDAPVNPISTEQNLTLAGIGINIGIYNSDTKKAGDILFTKNIGSHYSKKAFVEFGVNKLPHPTFFVPRGTKIISPVNGKVESLNFQASSNDYEIVIVPDGFPSWRISFDHVINVTKGKDDSVAVNQSIAEVAQSNSSDVPSDLGWFEFQVWKSTAKEMVAYCPFLLLKDGTKQDVTAKIKQLATDWNVFLGENVYDLKTWMYPGCLAETATP